MCEILIENSKLNKTEAETIVVENVNTYPSLRNQHIAL